MTLITLFYCVKHHKEINALKCLFLVYAPILKYLVIVLNLQLKANKIEIVILLRFLQFPKGCVVNDARISRKRRLQIVIPHGDRMKKDFALIKTIIKKNFPDFDVHSATKLGEGWMSEVFEINYEWAFPLAELKRFSGFRERDQIFTPPSRYHFF